MILSEITRIRITVGDYVRDNLTQQQVEDVVSGCRLAGVNPHVEVWFNGTDFAPVHAWLDAMLPPRAALSAVLRVPAPDKTCHICEMPLNGPGKTFCSAWHPSVVPAELVL